MDGVVTDVVLRPYADSNAYCPVIRYSVLGGATYTHNSDICSWPASYKQGQHVTLYVDRADPERVPIERFLFSLVPSFIVRIYGSDICRCWLLDV